MSVPSPRNFYQRVSTTTIAIIFAISSIMAAAVPLFLSKIADAAASTVLINEVSSASTQEWVELYSATNTDISGWVVQFDANDGTAQKVTLPAATTITAGGFHTVDTPNPWLVNTGDTVKVFNAASELQDEILVPGHTATQSYHRTTDGGSAWTVGSPTKGITNNPAVTPSLSFVANYYGTADYHGISLEIKTPNLTDATGVEITVNRTNGTPDVWTSKPTSTAAIDGLNGSAHTTTAPIVLVEGTRTRTSSSSWQTSGDAWKGNQKPTSITVRVTRAAGPALEQTVTSIGNAFGVTWPQVAIHLPYVPPSTNDANRTNGNGYVEEVSKTTSSVTLRFVNPKTPVICFEYRTDGDTSQDTGAAHPLETYGVTTSITDYYPYVCVTNGSTERTLDANSYVEVRSLFGAERNWDFDWTRFDVAAAPADTTKPTITVSPVVPVAISGIKSFDITINDDQPLDPTQNKSIWVELYGNPDQTKKRGQKVDLSSGTGTFTIDTTTLPDGEYILRVGSVKDAAGNTSGDKSFKYVTIDNTGPAGTITYSGGQNVNGVIYLKSINDLTYEGNFTDNYQLERTAYVVWKVDSAFKNRSVYCGNWPANSSTNAPLSGAADSVTGAVKDCGPSKTWENGYYEIGHRVYDALGHFTGLNSPTQKFVIDSERPVVELVSPAANSYNPSSYTVKATDNVGLKTVTANLYDETNSTLIKGCSVTVSPVGAAEYSISCPVTQGDGTYTIRFNAADLAGNVAMTKTSKFIVDKTAPVVDITSHSNGDSVSGVVNLVGTVTDTNPMNSLFRITGPNGYDTTGLPGYLLTDGRTTHEVTWDASALPNGEYTVTFAARDKAQNRTSVSEKTIKLTLNNPQPVVNGENFNTHDGSDYKGINVGFNIEHFKTVTEVSVGLYDASDNLLVTNTHNQALLDLIAGGTTQLSTPFIIQDGTYVETFWNLGTFTWSATTKPVKAVVTVKGTNNAGQDVEESATLTNLSEPNGWTYESLLPVVSPPPTPTPDDDLTPNFVQGFSTTTPNAPGTSRNLAARNTTTAGGTENLTTETEVTSNVTTDSKSQTKGAATTNTPKEKEIIANTSSNNFWWILAIIAALIAAYYGVRNYRSYKAE